MESNNNTNRDTNTTPADPVASRRSAIFGGLGVAAATAVAAMPSLASAATRAEQARHPDMTDMNTGMIIVKDGARIFYKDWGPKDAPVIWFHHGWPLTSDDWDSQMMFFLQHGYRVIAHDRRGHGRSTQTDTGNDMDTYSSDVAALATELKVTKAIHVGHSTGGGEVARFTRQYGKKHVIKAVLLSAVPPIMVQSATNPDGVPLKVFDDIRQGTAFNRPQFYMDLTIPFYGYNRPGAKVSEAIRQNWWRQGMMGGVKAAYDCIFQFAQVDFSDDLRAMDMPVLVMHGEDDQIVPFGNSAAKSVKLLKKGQLISYPGFPHGMPTTHADVINADLLKFFKA
ncbi:alpha/beta fold hydrolase [Janthinobacterium aquaticum]|nr:alpha/beta fold hydrolase [Janthinobacterium sp. FT58W]